MTDIQTDSDLRASQLSSALGTNAAAVAVEKQKRTRVFTIHKTAADAMASTTTSESLGGRFPMAGFVDKIVLCADAAVAADVTDNVQITVSKFDAAGANKTTLGTYDTTTGVQGAVSKRIDALFALTSANCAVVAGGTFTFEIAKGGSGKIVPISKIQVHVRDT